MKIDFFNSNLLPTFEISGIAFLLGLAKRDLKSFSHRSIGYNRIETQLNQNQPVVPTG